MPSSAAPRRPRAVVIDMAGDPVAMDADLAAVARQYVPALPETDKPPLLRALREPRPCSAPGVRYVPLPLLPWSIDAARGRVVFHGSAARVGRNWATVVRGIFHTLAIIRREPVLHASAVAAPEGALVFAGRSGAGKSTTALELCQGLPVLDDDMVFLRRGGPRGRVFVRSTAWFFGLRAAPPLVPVSRIFLIERGAKCRLLGRVPRAAAAAALTTDLFGPSTPAVLAERLARLTEILKDAPAYRLAVARDAAALMKCLGVAPRPNSKPKKK
jgi:hypothetical protein